MCLAVTKFVLWKINFDVWFIQIFLQKIHQIRQKKQNAAKENESTIVRQAARSTIAIALLVDRRARSSDDRAARRTIASLVDR